MLIDLRHSECNQRARDWAGVAPVELPDEDVLRVKREKVPAIVNSAPLMLLDKPIVTDVDYYSIDLSWTPATLPPNSTPTAFT